MSSSVSPGGETQSGANGAAKSVMVVSNKFNTNDGDMRPVYGLIITYRQRIVGGCEHKPPTACQIESKLAQAITLKRVRIARR